jgi:hypothetical protein
MDSENHKRHILDETLKQTDGKVAWEVFPFQEAEEVVALFEFGSIKYGQPFLYRIAGGIAPWKLAVAAIRHAIEILKGEMTDKESGLSHFAHIAATGLMGISTQRYATENGVREPRNK